MGTRTIVTRAWVYSGASVSEARNLASGNVASFFFGNFQITRLCYPIFFKKKIQTAIS